MTGKQHHIESVLQKLNSGYDELDSLIFLQQQGLNPDECKEIMDAALSQKRQQDIPQIAKKNKLRFVTWVSLTVLIFIIDIFVLPSAALMDYKFIVCISGTIALAVCGYFSLIYYKTWTPDFMEKHSGFKINFQGLPLFAIPGVVIYFFMSWGFDKAADESLAKDMIKTKGTIVSGYAISSRRSDIVSKVTVRFHTKEGKSITTTEDISSYAFKNFYEGQEVDMVYSKSDPENIDLLTDESDVRELTKSEERDINPKDLIELINVAPADMEARLDKITFGWQRGESDSTWINEKKQLAIKLGAKSVQLITTQNTGIIFPKRLAELGFKALDSGPGQPYSLKPQLFENDAYIVSIEYQNTNGNIMCLIAAMKK